MLATITVLYLCLFQHYAADEPAFEISLTDDSINSLYTLLPNILSGYKNFCLPKTDFFHKDLGFTSISLSAENFCITDIWLDTIDIQKPLLLSKHKIQIVTPGLNIKAKYVQVVERGGSVTRINTSVNINNYRLKTDIEFFYGKDGEILARLNNAKSFFQDININFDKLLLSMLYKIIDIKTVKMRIVQSIVEPSINAEITALDLRYLGNVEIADQILRVGLYELPSFYKKDGSNLYNISFGAALEGDLDKLESNIRQKEDELYKQVERLESAVESNEAVKQDALNNVLYKLLL